MTVEQQLKMQLVEQQIGVRTVDQQQIGARPVDTKTKHNKLISLSNVSSY